MEADLKADVDNFLRPRTIQLRGVRHLEFPKLVLQLESSSRK